MSWLETLRMKRINKKGMTGVLIDVLIGIAIAVALLPVIFGFLANSTTGGLNWSGVSLGGTVYNFSWVPYIIGLVLMIGLVYFGLKAIKHKR